MVNDQYTLLAASCQVVPYGPPVDSGQKDTVSGTSPSSAQLTGQQRDSGRMVGPSTKNSHAPPPC
eukprot:1243856-Ditylum_brightwellii.AAC.1